MTQIVLENCELPKIALENCEMPQYYKIAYEFQTLKVLISKKIIMQYYAWEGRQRGRVFSTSVS